MIKTVLAGLMSTFNYSVDYFLQSYFNAFKGKLKIGLEVEGVVLQTVVLY